ncbi:E3 binding domain-containing protein [Oscillatoria sp. FACHB-1407]|uniref:biotin/lipoyl-containing protein n=1 Tax=Oscillatoria sp. FACHB-1407 TaxID=2692847 RepID=UPI001683E42D|nr:biotin/lipoyl-containing protein [Oscillatoria sp. FACHB-1407]MBD2464747.1 E3 binding domain-containing protein [Oscillatoria sp. FACHB-1407]
MADFCMPSLGADMKTGTLVTWHVKPGDRLQPGDIIADVETDKGIMEIEVFEDTIVDELVLEPGTKVPVGTVMVRVHSETVTEMAKVTVPSQEPSPQQLKEKPSGEVALPLTPSITSISSGNGKRLRASPIARRLAAQLGVDLNQIQGTGPEGAIQERNAIGLWYEDFTQTTDDQVCQLLAECDRQYPQSYV